LAQQILINILSALIEQVAIMAIMKLFKKEEIEKEAEKDNLIRKQNTNLKRQIALQAILMAMGGGGAGSGGAIYQGGYGGAEHGGTVPKGQPYLSWRTWSRIICTKPAQDRLHKTARGTWVMDKQQLILISIL
jgi:hypothetical protein